MLALSNRAESDANQLCGWLLAVAAVASVAAPVHAQGLVQFEFTGVVTDNSGDLGVFGPFNGVNINDVFTGRFSYMTGPGNPDQQPADLQLGAYNAIGFEIDQAVVSITPFGIAVTHVPPLATLPPLPPDFGTDSFSAVGTFQIGTDNRFVSLRLEAPFESVFTDDSLPASLTLGDFTDTAIVRSIRVIGLEPGTSQIDAGIVTSLVLVPEPSPQFLALMSVGATLLMLRRRRAGRRSA
jgi:hypothetical protein